MKPTAGLFRWIYIWGKSREMEAYGVAPLGDPIVRIFFESLLLP
jgi:hypothetical protein